MNTLFTIKSSWYSQPWLFEQLGFASQGDTIVLIEDGVLAMQSSVSLASFMAKCQALEIRVYALQDDIKQRGIDSKYKAIKQIDYDALVDLVIQHDKQVAW